ncbi:uncharacterized protein TRUGW13939_04941 [Talaromyces rugulosus]|uniref:3-hydroxyisobutyrate dehydrogenase n=1 Tax=Talaromyces rugulosus TaxID=121627 RepID=A0A7H8QWJ7_TALRU|nr:uncharacterized protein TRUGW13939_04941 [Talaromyces rugulosus]QKX57821.1 hypothetical protein TRUGW13939_04941 [Talaromyces rugulosus]
MRITSVLFNAARYNTIGFIGLGAMGNHMVNNLISKAGQSGGIPKNFVVCDVNPDTVSRIIARHAAANPDIKVESAKTPEEIANKAATIISMVPTANNVREVYLGKSGVIRALEKLSKDDVRRTICIDESTIQQEESRSIANQVKQTGAEMIDAPVSGGTVGARDGTLTIMVGGKKDAFERARPILQSMGQRVLSCGDLGAGLAAKLANNLLLGISMMGVAEAMLLGKKLGLESQQLAEIINTSTGRCWSSEVNNPVPEVRTSSSSPPSHREYEGGFVTKLAHKDLALAVAAAKIVNSPVPLGSLTEEVYRPLAQPGSSFDNLDFSSIYKYFDEGRMPTAREQK